LPKEGRIVGNIDFKIGNNLEIIWKQKFKQKKRFGKVNN
jgi:hypothetical protein